jgi:hypothetical protein
MLIYIRRSILVIVSILLLSACSIFNNDEHKTAEYEFIAIGYATITAQVGASQDIKMLNAIKASKLEAYKELAEQVYGVMLTSENSVQEYQLQADGLKTKVKGLVRGAKVIRSYHEADIYITELGLNMKTLPYLKDAEFEEVAESGNVISVPSQVYY